MRIGITASAFDMGPHAGHIMMLKEAKENCDFLYAFIHVDPSKERDWKDKPLQPLHERFVQVSNSKYVDAVIPYQTEAELVELIKLISPDIRFLGEDYKGKDFTGKELPIPVYYCKRRHSVSSSNLRNKAKA